MIFRVSAKDPSSDGGNWVMIIEATSRAKAHRVVSQFFHSHVKDKELENYRYTIEENESKLRNLIQKWGKGVLFQLIIREHEFNIILAT